MALEIAFELQDADLQRLATVFGEARKRAVQMGSEWLSDTARERLKTALEKDRPEFIQQRLEGLSELATMLGDEAWQLPDQERRPIMEALAYFVAPNDAIPDSLPVLGLLDDAIVAELVLRSLRHELEAYREFSQYRRAEMQRRANAGVTTEVSKADWLADRRATLHSRMRERRLADPEGWHTVTLFNV